MTAERDISAVIDEIVDHIDYIHDKLKDRSIADFRADRDTRQIVERSLEIISEASRRIPHALKTARPEIPWRQVADFGNILRHTYFAVNSDIVWRIASEDLEPLRQAFLDIRKRISPL